MKPEPLKDKLRIAQLFGTTKLKGDFSVFKETDIKSAVEWLKGKMSGSLDHESFKIFHKGITIAFADVAGKPPLRSK